MKDFCGFYYTFMNDFCWKCYIFMNDFLSYNKIRGEILKTIIDNYLEQKYGFFEACKNIKKSIVILVVRCVIHIFCR